MKIQFPDTMKRILTVAEMPAVKVVREGCKDDNGKTDFTFEANVAMNLAMPNANFEIMKIEAEITKNCRIWNAFGATDADGYDVGESSRDLDVWVTTYAYSSYDGFYVAGAYLTDIWKIGPEEANKEVLRNMYIRKFKEVN